ncbi:MAG: single-stranded DNA-binding protein [Lewinellaceae bacterium]|nr:single-stranded DNA-binding protein [Lewinellaceae bacterium]
MNNLRNKVQLIGNLGKEVEYKELENGNAIARVTIATKEVYKNPKGEKVVDVQWHNLVGWGRVAEIMQVLLKKGREVAVQGKLTHRSYEDKKGQKRYISEVIVDEFMPLN